MSKPYEPREGSLADKVMGLLEINGGAMSSGEISRAFDIPISSVQSGLFRSVDNGILFTYLRGVRKYYTLVRPEDRQIDAAVRPTAAPAEPTAAPAEPTPSAARPILASRLDDFHAAVWADGELNLHGVTPNDNGVTVLSAKQAAQVLRLLSGRMYA